MHLTLHLTDWRDWGWTHEQITLRPIPAEHVCAHIYTRSSKGRRTMRWDTEASRELMLANLNACKVNVCFEAFVFQIVKPFLYAAV